MAPNGFRQARRASQSSILAWARLLVMSRWAGAAKLTAPSLSHSARREPGSRHRSSARARVLARFASLLDTRKTELARIISAEHGKTVSDAEGDVTRGLEVVEFATGAPQLLQRRLQRQCRHWRG